MLIHLLYKKVNFEKIYGEYKNNLLVPFKDPFSRSLPDLLRSQFKRLYQANLHDLIYESVTKSFRTESITKQTTTINTR
jgi:hypothetical protein